MTVFVSILLFIILALLLLLKPAPKGEAWARMAPFAGLRYAHRGLHDLALGVPENSLPAFQRAVDHGFGVELDVHLTVDGRLVVFHDDTLLRSSGVDRAVALCSYEELKTYKIFGTEHTIPLFEEVLAVVGGKIPLIVELKHQGGYEALCRAVMDTLDGYSGRYCVESFFPGIVRWFMKNRPEVCRGFLSMDFLGEGKSRQRLMYFLSGNLLVNGLCKPHFIAYREEDSGKAAFRLCRALFGCPTVGWTVKSQGREEELYGCYDAIIFEQYLPESPVLPGAEQTGR